MKPLRLAVITVLLTGVLTTSIGGSLYILSIFDNGPTNPLYFQVTLYGFVLLLVGLGINKMMQPTPGVSKEKPIDQGPTVCQYCGKVTVNKVKCDKLRRQPYQI